MRLQRWRGEAKLEKRERSVLSGVSVCGAICFDVPGGKKLGTICDGKEGLGGEIDVVLQAEHEHVDWTDSELRKLGLCERDWSVA